MWKIQGNIGCKRLMHLIDYNEAFAPEAKMRKIRASPMLVVPTWPLRSPPIKSFLLVGTLLTTSSQVLPKLPLSAHVEPNLWGINTNNVQDKISNN
jgi:hypothetical protein